MKNLLLMVLLCLCSIAYAQEQEQVPKILVKTSFDGRRCNGSHGLCTIGNPTTKSQSNTQLIFNTNNTITFIIDKAKISNEEINKIIGDEQKLDSYKEAPTFYLNYAFVLEVEVKTQLEIPKGLTKISKGSYPILITEEAFIITFNLE